jgi:hypothetical protein
LLDATKLLADTTTAALRDLGGITISEIAHFAHKAGRCSQNRGIYAW